MTTAIVPETSTWQLDASHSSIGFSVKHLMIATVKGSFAKYEASFSGSDNDLSDAKVNVNIETASIDTGNAQRDGHLRSADFFDVENHPTIEFESTRVEHKDRGDYRVTGDLTMHGETHPVTLDVTVHGVTRDAQGHDRVGLEARGTLKRSDFGLRWQQALETGGVLVADEVRISADIAAVCNERPEA